MIVALTTKKNVMVVVNQPLRVIMIPLHQAAVLDFVVLLIQTKDATVMTYVQVMVIVALTTKKNVMVVENQLLRVITIPLHQVVVLDFVVRLIQMKDATVM